MLIYLILSFTFLFVIILFSVKSKIIKTIIVIFLIIISISFILQTNNLVSKGNDTINNFENFYLFLSMILGMISHYFFHEFEKVRFKFNFKKMIRPLFISPIIFSSIYYISNESREITLLLYLFSFQNGFFWQTILDKEQKKISNNNKS